MKYKFTSMLYLMQKMFDKNNDRNKYVMMNHHKRKYNEYKYSDQYSALIGLKILSEE